MPGSGRPTGISTLVGLGGPVTPTVVLASEPRIRQVVTNLVANALRHTPAGTPVEIAVGLHGGEGVLEVRDHGDGVPPQARAKVFERFYRADPARGRVMGGGNGLGLAIVAAIITQHSGRVGVAETPAAVRPSSCGSRRRVGLRTPEPTLPRVGPG